MLDDQPEEWRTVIRQVRNLMDARALFGMFEYGSDTLFANELPIDALVTGVALLSERCLAGFLTDYLNTLDPAPAWTYLDIYVDGRGEPELRPLADDLVARCRHQGVVLAHRPSPPTPWRVVFAQIASEGDGAAARVLLEDYLANNWWFDLETDLERPALTGRAPSPAELADFIVRCRTAGVVLRRM